ncbi:MAG: hypothetical protein IPJ13_00405 [Saprospiraceae bacterium]|nr:hypothetical protein [Saprospiraceae bacterium]
MSAPGPSNHNSHHYYKFTMSGSTSLDYTVVVLDNGFLLMFVGSSFPLKKITVKPCSMSNISSLREMLQDCDPASIYHLYLKTVPYFTGVPLY